MGEQEALPAESNLAEVPPREEVGSGIPTSITADAEAAPPPDSAPAMPPPSPKTRFPRRLARPVPQPTAQPGFVWPTPPGFPGDDPLDIADVVKRVQQGLDVDFDWQAGEVFEAMKAWKAKYPDRGSPDDAVKIWEKANLALALEMNLVSSALASPVPEQESVSAAEEEDPSSLVPTEAVLEDSPRPAGPRAGSELGEVPEPTLSMEDDSSPPPSSDASSTARGSFLFADMPSGSETGMASAAPVAVLAESPISSISRLG